MSDGDFLALLRGELGKLPGYIRHGTFQAVCRRAAEAGDRAFGAAAAADNRDRLLAAVWAAAAQELEKVAHALVEEGRECRCLLSLRRPASRLDGAVLSGPGTKGRPWVEARDTVRLKG